MRRDFLLYQQALFLRKKKGYSYSEISTELGVSKSTLSGWLQNITLSKEHQHRIRMIQRERWSRNFNLGVWNRKKRQAEIKLIRENAAEKIGSLSEREFLIAGVMLYWAEGDKVSNVIRISNSDPSFHLFMMEWFRKCLNVTEDRFQGTVHYHQGQDCKDIEVFWSDLTGIPLMNFRKPFCKPPGTGHRKHYLQWGTFRVRITKSADLLHQIQAWKDGLIQKVISGTQRGRP